MNGRKVVIDETTAEIVRFIYEQYSLGKTVKEIISNLTANNNSPEVIYLMANESMDMEEYEQNGIWSKTPSRECI